MVILEQIIECLDESLIKKGKSSIDLNGASKILIENNFYQTIEDARETLDYQIQKGNIPKARFNKKTKKYNVGLSKKGKNLADKILWNKKHGYDVSLVFTYGECDNCGTKTKYWSNCGKCSTYLQLPKIDGTKPDISSKKLRENKKGTNGRIDWKSALSLIGIIAFIIAYIFLKDSNLSKSYIITEDVYGASSYETFDELTLYAIQDDIEAINNQFFAGQIEVLPRGIEVYVIESSFTYVIVRKKGGSKKYWIPKEYIKKK